MEAAHEKELVLQYLNPWTFFYVHCITRRLDSGDSYSEVQ